MIWGKALPDGEHAVRQVGRGPEHPGTCTGAGQCGESRGWAASLHPAGAVDSAQDCFRTAV